MHELLPEVWASQGGDSEANKPGKRARSRKKVQDINVWLQCFALYVGVRASGTPKLISELTRSVYSGPAKNMTVQPGRHTMRHIGDRRRPRDTPSGRR